MVTCWAPDCEHSNEREKCKFFTFPKDENERRRWKTLLKQDEEPGLEARICSCHFKDEIKENGPEIFEHNQATLSPEKKKKRMEATSSEAGLSKTVEEHQSTSFPLSSSTSEKEEDDLVKNMQLMDPSVGEIENSRKKKEFTFSHISDNDKLVRLYTGFHNSTTFLALFILMKNIPLNYYDGGKLLENVDKIDQLFMTLMKLRQNFPQDDLAIRFNVSRPTVTNIIITWIHALHEVLFQQLMAEIPSCHKNQSCDLNCFPSFKNCRIILNYDEVETTLPYKPVRKLKAVHSPYSLRYNWKFLVGVAPNGVITYVSKLYPVLNSGNKVVKHCGILDQLQPGDLVLTDEGFLLKDLLPQGVISNTPPLANAPCTYESIPEAGIFVDRAVRRMKRYKILDSIPHSLRTYGSTIVQLVGALTNLQPVLVREEQEDYSSESDDEQY